jgi:hypothetical protein
MLWYAAAAALACWLLLLGYSAVAARPRWTRAGSPSLALRDEPPAVVSLLAGRADRDGFPATLLDLAARGWLVLDHRSGGQLACLLPDSAPAERLTPYEAMAVERVTVRVSGSGWVPAAALAADFRPARRRTWSCCPACGCCAETGSPGPGGPRSPGGSGSGSR